MAHLRQIWSSSKLYRITLIAALVYVLLRLAIQGVLIASLSLSGETEGYDLQIYLDAATRLQVGQDLYPEGKWDRAEVYYYTPAFALLFIPFSQLPLAIPMIALTLLHLVAYGLLYAWWDGVFRRLDLDRAREVLAWALPIWLVSSSFWGDLSYLNIYVFVTLLATLFIDAILNEHLGRLLLWLSVILQAKPQWAFAIAVPLLLGRWRLFVKLVGLAILVYGAIAGITILAVGPSYGWQQYVDYFRFLWNVRDNFPWRGPDMPFLGYNHSITQSVVYLLGLSPAMLRLATGIKLLLLLPLAAVGLRHLLWPAQRVGRNVPQVALDWAFALYLGAFIWLDVIWELSLGVVVFTYLLATLRQRAARVLAWVVFLPYALLDIWRLLSVAVFGLDIVVPGPFVLTDPAIHVPLIMVVILAFYALLVKRLWTARMYRGSEAG